MDCRYCSLPFVPDRNNVGRQKYCSAKCSKLWWSDYLNPGRISYLATGTVGAISELAVTKDLLERGFEVYRSMSPASASDLVIAKGNSTYTVEVRTGKIGLNGDVQYPKKNIKALILAIYLPDFNDIVYLPELPDN